MAQGGFGEGERESETQEVPGGAPLVKAARRQCPPVVDRAQRLDAREGDCGSLRMGKRAGRVGSGKLGLLIAIW